MPLMTSVTTSQPRQRTVRVWELALLACGSFASLSGLAQTDVDAIDTAAPPNEAVAADAPACPTPSRTQPGPWS